ILADSATDAKIGIYAGPLQYLLCSVSKLHLNVFKPNRLWRCGTDLFADNAVNIHCPGKAPAPVVECNAYFDRFLSGALSQFFFNRERDDSTSRAYMATEHTVIFTIPYFANEQRGPDSLKSCLQQRRLDCI